MQPMTTVSEVINHLKNEGYLVDFNLKENCIECHGNYLQIFPDEFVIDKSYRFEGLSDPADEAIVYAISSPKYNVKGILVDGYGVSSEALTNEMIQALKKKEE
jgi:hypothetical protein